MLIVISNLMATGIDSRSRQFYFYPPKGIEHFQFGFRETTADALWVRVIQDFDYCEATLTKKACKGQSWVYQVINAISYLSPHFHNAIYSGAMMLTIVVNDFEGASKIFDRAVELYPDDWRVLYGAAYHAMIEEKDKAKAARLLQSAASHGAPTWVYALATKMYTESGEKELAQSLYQTLKSSGMSEDILEQVRKRLEP